MVSLTIYEGNDKSWTITIKDSEDDAIDITGYTFLFTVKSKISDEDADALISKNITSHTSPTTGVTTLSVDRTDTVDLKPSSYPCDLQMIDTSSKRTTIFKGTFSVSQSVGDRNI